MLFKQRRDREPSRSSQFNITMPFPISCMNSTLGISIVPRSSEKVLKRPMSFVIYELALESNMNLLWRGGVLMDEVVVDVEEGEADSLAVATLAVSFSFFPSCLSFPSYYSAYCTPSTSYIPSKYVPSVPEDCILHTRCTQVLFSFPFPFIWMIRMMERRTGFWIHRVCVCRRQILGWRRRVR